MAQCVNCGREAARPVWAVYADEAFADKQQSPFALHQKCFTANERITATKWVPQKGSDDLELVEFEMTRYRKAKGPNG